MLLFTDLLNTLRCPITQLGDHYDCVSERHDRAIESGFASRNNLESEFWDFFFPSSFPPSPSYYANNLQKLRQRKETAAVLLAAPDKNAFTEAIFLAKQVRLLSRSWEELFFLLLPSTHSLCLSLSLLLFKNLLVTIAQFLCCAHFRRHITSGSHSSRQPDGRALPAA